MTTSSYITSVFAAMVLLILLTGAAEARWQEVCTSNVTHCSGLSAIACVGQSTCYTGTTTGVYLFDAAQPGSQAKRIHSSSVDFLVIGGTPLAPGGVVVIGRDVYYLSSPGSFSKSDVTLDAISQAVRVSRDGRGVLMFSWNSTLVHFSADGGKTFAKVAVPLPASLPISTVSLVTAKTWVIVAQNLDGTTLAVLKTTNGGASFQQLNSGGISAAPTSIDCASEERCVVVGMTFLNSVVYVTTDGGNSWQQTLTFGGGYSDVHTLPAVRMASVESAWATGTVVNQWRAINFIYRSTDGGSTWKKAMDGMPGNVTGTFGLSFPVGGWRYVAVSFSRSAGSTAVFRFEN